MRIDQETVLNHAIKALQASTPEAEQLQLSARRVADRLGLNSTPRSSFEAIENCEDVQHSMAAYRAGELTNPRYLLIRAHLRECGICHRYYGASPTAATVDWSTPGVTRSFNWHPRRFAWALAPTFALLATFFFVYRAFWQVPPGVRAEVQSVDGSAYRTSDAGDHLVAAGDKLLEGDQLRTSGGGHAVLRLADGSTVEVNERSVLGVGARGKNTTIALNDGAVIVQATHRSSGHLYVRTPDCRVAVTGTVFSVNSGIKGSRVAVLEGSLHVTHAGTDTLMRAGEQVSTNQNLGSEPVNQQISWSHDRDKYLLLLAQFDTLQRRLDQIPSPGLRYRSDLLQRVPADTLLYVSIPNLGDFLGEANTIFNDQLQKSPALRQWWNSGAGHDTSEINTLVDQLHQVSQYLGDEIVIVGRRQEKHPGFAVVADVKQGGLDTFLRNQAPVSPTLPHLTVFNQSQLNAASALPVKDSSGYALVREHEAVFSDSIATLKLINAQLNAGDSGFASTDFGTQIASAYSRGAGMILAADLHQMLPDGPDAEPENRRNAAALENSGVRDVRYLIAEHREKNGLPENHLDLQFAGSRQGIASWLAAPAPIGSLEFVTPNAAIAVAALSKDPAAIADDVMRLAAGDGNSPDQWTDAEAKLHIDLRNDLAANLGGDFLMALDGPMLPTPAWKVVVEVHDADRLQKTIESLVEAVQQERANETGGKQVHRIAISSTMEGSQRFYRVQDVDSDATVAQYTFADGYMILAQDHSVLLQSIRAHTSGNSLARSNAFKALLPADENANYSAVAYQNLSPVLTPLLSNFSGDLADAVRQMAADARPTAICAWGKDTTIEAASNSHLLGFDLLALQAMIHPDPTHAWNKQAAASVKD